MNKIFWTDTAVKNLNNIFDYISADSKFYADVLVNDIFESIEQIKIFSKSGRVVPEIADKNTREIFVGSYRIIYEVKNKQVRILTIIHGVRKL